MRSRRRGGAGRPPWPVSKMLALCLLSLAWLSEGFQRSEPMFTAVTHRLLPPDYDSNPTQLNYGVAVTDLDADGDFEIVVAGYNGPNLVLKYDKAQGRLVNVAEDERGSPYYALRDRQGNAIGVTACDIDGDGREEIYFLNTNNAFSGMATYTDKLFKLRNGRWEDILSDEVNQVVASRFAGRSVACVDRTGSGRYSIYIANYASGNVGPHALIEMDVAASDPARGVVVLVDVAAQAGVSKYTGGRGVAVGPILSDSASDIFCGNENSPNFLFHNWGDGTYRDVAAAVGLDDPYQHGRGVALADFNRDGRVDIVYGNWNGPHRLYLQSGAPGRVRFRDIATPKFSMPSPVRTVIAADFDNDQELEVFFNNIAYRGSSANRLFRLIRREHSDPIVEELNPGDALEPEGRGTGGAVTDFDGDGMLDLILSHGESMAQPISIFKGTQGRSNNWLRVIPRTRFGAFARGAKVVLFTRRSGAHLRIIDGGSGYLCEMEPVAHFGLGRDEASSLEVTWPDGRVVSRAVASSEINSVLEVPYPLDVEEPLMPAPLETQMSALSSPLSVPVTSPSASTPMAGTAAAATSAAAGALSPTRMAQLVWTSTSVLRACTTAASSAPTPLGHTPAAATQASAPLILLLASAWVSTCRQQLAAHPWHPAWCNHAALGAEMLFPEVPSCAHSPRPGGWDGQTVAVQEFVE
ncbi:cartilage acidic protein 1 isoform X4 [Neopelma chrysocephalum]|uniref:cartilage acidic protein 1 isoform X4 n=1 Tax=Neopelma chrysocephalum TaxID=114329 RepID=UPI000FCD377F|nr:cartilage acidic protein 1 isoform X4 [Neopelma chrysocephalum]